MSYDGKHRNIVERTSQIGHVYSKQNSVQRK